MDQFRFVHVNVNACKIVTFKQFNIVNEYTVKAPEEGFQKINLSFNRGPKLFNGFSSLIFWKLSLGENR